MNDRRFPGPGDWMRFLGRNGYPHELDEARKIFASGQTYMVADCDVQNWSHSVKFVGINGRYNGVMFERVEKPSSMKDHWDPSMARPTDPDTSKQAAAKVTKRLTGIRLAVMDLFKVRREMTDMDLQEYFGGPESSYRKRRTELVEMGLVRDSGRKVMQKGSNRTIWEIVP